MVGARLGKVINIFFFGVGWDKKHGHVVNKRTGLYLSVSSTFSVFYSWVRKIKTVKNRTVVLYTLRS